MVSTNVTITNPVGLHARPATQLISLLKAYKCRVFLYNGTKEANAGSIINLLTLGAKQGTELKITCDGEDENEALKAVADFLANMKD